MERADTRASPKLRAAFFIGAAVMLGIWGWSLVPAIESRNNPNEDGFSFIPPHAIASLEKFDGRSVETQGPKTYEMRVFVVLNYTGDKLQCRTSFCPELQNYLVNVDEAAKKVTVAGWLFFEHAVQGWR